MPKKNIEREELLEQVEELITMKFTTPTEIMRATGIGDPNTAKNYVAIARRRMRNRESRQDLANMRKAELREINLAIKKSWKEYHLAGTKTRDKAKLLLVIAKFMDRKSQLMGYDEPKKFMGALVGGKLTKLRKSTITQDEVTDLRNKLLRAGNELDNKQGTGERAPESGSEERAVALRPSVPVASSDGESADVSHGHSEPDKSTTSGGSGPA